MALPMFKEKSYFQDIKSLDKISVYAQFLVEITAKIQCIAVISAITEQKL